MRLGPRTLGSCTERKANIPLLLLLPPLPLHYHLGTQHSWLLCHHLCLGSHWLLLLLPSASRIKKHPKLSGYLLMRFKLKNLSDQHAGAPGSPGLTQPTSHFPVGAPGEIDGGEQTDCPLSGHRCTMFDIKTNPRVLV